MRFTFWRGLLFWRRHKHRPSEKATTDPTPDICPHGKRLIEPCERCDEFNRVVFGYRPRATDDE